MPPLPKLLLVLLVAIGLGITGYFAFRMQPPGGQSSPPESDNSKPPVSQAPPPPHPLYLLGQHHCGKLETDTQQTACLTQIEKDINNEQYEPSVPEVDPLACNGISDPIKQHECHGWMGHNFAVSTGDISHCNVIPQDTIKASCQQQIVINEIKKLYALENTTGDSPQ